MKLLSASFLFLVFLNATPLLAAPTNISSAAEIAERRISQLEGHAAGNGGGAEIITALPFPKPALLESAVSLVQEKLKTADLPSWFKLALTKELRDVLMKKQILYLPGKLVEIPGRTAEGYSDVVSINAYTRLETGAPIYLMEETLSYDNSRMAELLAHEGTHHLELDLSTMTEMNVQRVAEELVTTGKVTDETRETLRLARFLWLESNKISSDLLIREILSLFDCLEEKYGYLRPMPRDSWPLRFALTSNSTLLDRVEKYFDLHQFPKFNHDHALARVKASPSKPMMFAVAVVGAILDQMMAEEEALATKNLENPDQNGALLGDEKKEPQTKEKERE